MILSLEGLPGTGKTTQARMLAEHLCSAGHRVAYLPDLATLTSDPIGDRLSDLFTASGDPFKRNGDAVLDTHLAAAIRTNITATIIAPAQRDHDIIIEDRGLHTMQSYSLATLLHTRRPGRDVHKPDIDDSNLDQAFSWLTAISQATGPGPDLALWLRPPAQTAITRAQTRDRLTYTLEQRSYLHQVDTAYALIADRDSRLTEIPINSTDTPDAVHHLILERLKSPPGLLQIDSAATVPLHS